jgi:hypothetical protein
MKNKLALLTFCLPMLLNFSVQGQDKKMKFPLVDFAYAEVYYYNLEEQHHRPVTYIYTPVSGMAKNAVAANVKLHPSDLVTVHQIIDKGLDGLLLGTSSCFIPRHGIVYYGNQGEVVAAMSICFECGSIRFWDSKKGDYTTRVKKPDTQLIEKQLKAVKDELVQLGVKVVDNVEEYAELIQPQSPPVKENPSPKTITIQDNRYVEAIFNNGYHSELLSWLDDCTNVLVREDTKYTAGGDKYIFLNITEKDVQFLFSKINDNWVLGEGKVSNTCVRLPNGIRVGDTLDKVLQTFLVYDGISSPDSITVVGQSFKIVYTFEAEILVSITLGLP